jgi:putative Holliday junction resolvase
MTNTKPNICPDKFYQKTLLGIDFGTKVTGISLFAQGQDFQPYPYASLTYRNDENLIRDILKIVKTEDVTIVVLGVPQLLDGKETSMSQKIRNFGKKLKKLLNKDILFEIQDETLSSFEAKERMKNSPRYNFTIDSSKIDEVAATIILEDYLKNNGYHL